MGKPNSIASEANCSGECPECINNENECARKLFQNKDLDEHEKLIKGLETLLCKNCKYLIQCLGGFPISDSVP